MAIILVAVIAVIVATAAPALATAQTCRMTLACFQVVGSGVNVDQAKMWLDRFNDDCCLSGHMQVRYRVSGVDHYKDSAETVIRHDWDGPKVTLDLYVSVFTGTYVCGRWWHWNGSSWTLPYGDWQCIYIHS